VAMGLAAFPFLRKMKFRRDYAEKLAAAKEPMWPGSSYLRNVSGIPTLVAMSEESVNKWKTGEFKHRSSDVWVTSYPKSGTTWSQVIVLALLNQTLKRTSPDDLRRACPTYERRGVQDLELYPEPRCLKTHWRHEAHAASPGRGRVIWVVRRAVDVALSFFHFMNMISSDLGGGHTPLEAFEEDFIAGLVPFGDYFEHFASWWKQRNEPDVYMLRYEALKADRRKEIEGVAKFLGGTAPEQVDIAFDASDFKEMKASESRLSRFAIINILFGDYFKGTQTTRVRSGKSGEGKLAFSPEFLEALEKKYLEVLEPLGVPRDYVF